MSALQNRRAYHIAVVDTGSDLRTIRRSLTKRGFRICAHTSTQSALERALASPPSMFILETDVGTGDGLELCKEIRRTAGLSLVPIVMVSHRSRVWDVVAGLQAGADDYMIKPLREQEMLARVDATLRRCYELNQSRVVRFDAIEINSDAITLTVRGKRHGLAPAEFRLLDYLVHNPGRAFSRAHLLAIMRSRPGSVKHRMIDVIVKRIRYAIEPDQQNPKYLRTVKGFGYCFYLPETATGIENRAKQ